MHLYHVKPGDTLQSVAHQHRITTAALRAFNSLPQASYLLPGHALLIPSRLTASDLADDVDSGADSYATYVATDTDSYATYRVQAGDTLRSIGERFRVPLTWIALCNHLSDRSLEAGELLLIPASSSQARGTKKKLGLLCLSPSRLPEDTSRPITFQGRSGLRVDAAGNLHLPALPDRQDGDEKLLLLCSLDGAANILADVAKAILTSEEAQARLLDRLGTCLRLADAHGVIFDWQSVRREDEPAYLRFVKEAGRRLRPIGHRTGLLLFASSTCFRRASLLAELGRQIDLLLVEPVANSSAESPPPPLIGTEDTRRALQTATATFPAEKTWLVLRPSAVFVQRGQAVQHLSQQQAIDVAYLHGSPLIRDEASELTWYRFPNIEEGHSVWLEDIQSFVRKLEILEQMKLQGIALWEVGGYFPDAWRYLYEQYEVLMDEAEGHK
ncbi:LysM peptidoglycan-binding domain-containing protein [Tumebacillus lipolyticus]|uniref:LysM peptidoglycan-binding domain-containing protein n=1 Tax=Tumebacillus lipolyticus TaxID=1280370 RepID=A0ABW4ZTB0_9BACL